MNDARPAAARIEAELTKAGLDGCVHAVDIGTGTQVGYRGEELCAAASTAKVAILVALMRAVAAGDVDLDERIVIEADHRTAGPSGLSVMTQPCELALGDVAELMISISDNHATDIVLRRVPPQRVTSAMRDLGLTVTTLDMAINELYEQLLAARSSSGLDLRPEAAAWRTTPAEMSALLRLIWLDQAAPAELCARMRAMLHSCLTSNGFDSFVSLTSQVRLGNKTGTLVLVDEEAGVSLIARNEVGVFEYPDGGRYAIAVCTRQAGGDPVLHDPSVSLAIGATAQIAIDFLRGPAV
jgi:beta-lactamase class A